MTLAQRLNDRKDAKPDLVVDPGAMVFVKMRNYSPFPDVKFKLEVEMDKHGDHVTVRAIAKDGNGGKAIYTQSHGWV